LSPDCIRPSRTDLHQFLRRATVTGWTFDPGVVRQARRCSYLRRLRGVSSSAWVPGGEAVAPRRSPVVGESELAEGMELDRRHRVTVERIFNHPVSHNIQWHDVLCSWSTWAPSPKNIKTGTR